MERKDVCLVVFLGADNQAVSLKFSPFGKGDFYPQFLVAFYRQLRFNHAAAGADVRQSSFVFVLFGSVSDFAAPSRLFFHSAKEALVAGKHILVEKPCTTALANTEDLLKEADEKGLAAHENYMFAFHDQLEAVNGIVKSGEIGDVRLYRISFGFPMRAQNDFRYNKALGGGALLDCGGYTMKYASLLLGPTAQLKYAQSNNIEGFSVDMYGSAALVNDEGVTAQIAFGMDHNYKCELEVWCSKGTLYTNRILTAPAGLVPEVIIRKGNEEEKRNLPADDAFKKSILHFCKCIEDADTRKANYETLLRQARLVEDFKRLANIDVK